jgi:hypothetical protein
MLADKTGEKTGKGREQGNVLRRRAGEFLPERTKIRN